MQPSTKQLPKGQVELTIEVPVEDIKPLLDAAVEQLTKNNPIQGFRPGKAPYEVVKQRFSEMAIYETALPSVVKKHYVKAVLEADVLSYGEPEIEIVKLTPGNPVVFKAKVAVIPKITALADIAKIKVEAKPVKIEDKQVDDMVRELQRMQTTEHPVDRELGPNDKVVVDMNLMVDNVPVEGGQTRHHSIYLNEEYYIPRMKEQILGLKKGDSKKFMLPFPKDHFQKTLAGKDVQFDVTITDIVELRPPEVNDEFAKRMGQESVAKLRELLKKNIEAEAHDKERQREEIEIIEKISDGSKFEEIPEAILNQEVSRMIDELRHSIQERGLEFESYLVSIKKTTDDLKLDFAQQAVKRVKSALVVREFGKRENIEITDAEFMVELNNILNRYSNDAESQNRIRTEDYQDYLRTTLRNQKTLKKLREMIVK